MPSTGRLLYVMGLLLMLLCILDVALQRFAKIDLTGQTYTPIVLGGLGIILMNVSRFFPRPTDDDEDEE